MMACVLVPLVFAVLLTETSASASPSGAESTSPCPHRWLRWGQRCFTFYPVWSSWSNAESMCSLAGGNLASLHTLEEMQVVRQLASTDTPVWLGGHQQNGSWSWSNGSPFRSSGWTNQTWEKPSEGGACMQMATKSGELHGAPCDELRFYICSTSNCPEVLSNSTENGKAVKSDLVPGVSLFDVVWDRSEDVAEDIVRSSSFLQQLRSCQLKESCYTNFRQQEALYLHRVSSTLEALLSCLQGPDDVRSMLLDTLKTYSSSSRDQSLLTSPSPQWLRFSLESFHTLVSEEPVYWLVALSARAIVHDVMLGVLHGSESDAGKACSICDKWSEESKKEVTWTESYRKLLEKHQDQMDAFKAINIFRQHMMNQKSFYKAVDCDVKANK